MKYDFEQFITEMRAEHARALSKYPAPNANGTALASEAGEVATALNKEPRANVVAEAVQTAVMAARVAIEGDPYQDAYRATVGLDATATGDLTE